MHGGLGVRFLLLVAVVGIVVFGLSVVYIVTNGLLHTSVTTERIDRDAWLIDGLAQELGAGAPADAILERRVAGWQSAFAEMCLGLIDPSGRPLPGSRRRLLGCLSEEQLAAVTRPDAPRSQVVQSGGQEQLVVAAALPPGPGGVRRLVAVSSLAQVAKRVALSQRLVLLFMGLSVLLVSVLGYAVLTQLIVRPLTRTMRTIERVAEGDLAARVRPIGARELRDLSDAFNRLTDKLEVDEHRISEQLSELRRINARLEEAKDELVRSEKLASVGRLAAGVAHEIGNPISIVLGYLEMMARPDVTDDERVVYLEQASEATQRISGIIRDLLDFSRPDPGEPDPRADVGAVVSRTVQLVAPQRQLRAADIQVSLPEGPVMAAIGPRRLQQVLVNLLLNAADACAQADAPTIAITVTVAGRSVRIRVQDDGPGVPEGLEGRIFDPFFTTKEPGKGTGLGLSVCYSIVTGTGGDIRLERPANRGAAFVVDLPLVDRTPVPMDHDA